MTATRVSQDLPRRELGRTGERLSIIGMGGIVVMDEQQEVADRLVREAFEAGVNYFDVAPTYGDAEEKLGPALEPFRKQAFLACKTAERDADGARRELESSLRRLRTDWIDLYQLHSLESREDLDRAFGPGGAIETLVRARQEGKVRFLGFSAHSVEAALAAIGMFDFDSVLFQINYACWLAGGYGPQVVERARDRGMAVLALKAGARAARDPAAPQRFPKCWYRPLEDEDELRRAFSFTLSLPVTAALPPGDVGLFRTVLRIAPSLNILSEQELEKLRRQAQQEQPLFCFPTWKP